MSYGSLFVFPTVNKKISVFLRALHTSVVDFYHKGTKNTESHKENLLIRCGRFALPLSLPVFFSWSVNVDASS